MTPSWVADMEALMYLKKKKKKKKKWKRKEKKKKEGKRYLHFVQNPSKAQTFKST